jgi:hypothetical protein
MMKQSAKILTKHFPCVDTVQQPYACARAYAIVSFIRDSVVRVCAVFMHYGTIA